jgi:hypothetical protein
MMVREEAFWVRFANDQGNGVFSSLAEARRVIERRAEYDPPPPGAFPAEIWLQAFENGELVANDFVERYPPDP